MAQEQCLNCGNPAVSKEGTVPLCQRCADLAKDKQRGVQYEPKPSQDDQRPSS